MEMDKYESKGIPHLQRGEDSISITFHQQDGRKEEDSGVFQFLITPWKSLGSLGSFGILHTGIVIICWRKVREINVRKMVTRKSLVNQTRDQIRDQTE